MKLNIPQLTLAKLSQSGRPQNRSQKVLSLIPLNYIANIENYVQSPKKFLSFHGWDTRLLDQRLSFAEEENFVIQ